MIKEKKKGIAVEKRPLIKRSKLNLRFKEE